MTGHGNFIWYELLTTDVEAAGRFYNAVIGWTQGRHSETGLDYRMWSIGGETIGGLMAIPAAAQGMPPSWLGYVDVADVDASVSQVTASGGTVHMPPTDVAGAGRFAFLADPQGAAFYIMTPEIEAQSPVFAPGKPGHGGWHELHTTDYEAALAFYGTHFGWGRSGEHDMGPRGVYAMFNTGGDAVGGMVRSHEGPPRWLYYFNVDDIEAAKQRIKQAGGVIVNGPLEVPGGSWIIQARDPQDAMFALVGPRTA